MTPFTADYPTLDLAAQIDLAERRFSHALVQGCSARLSGGFVS